MNNRFSVYVPPHQEDLLRFLNENYSKGFNQYVLHLIRKDMQNKSDYAEVLKTLNFLKQATLSNTSHMGHSYPYPPHPYAPYPQQPIQQPIQPQKPEIKFEPLEEDDF